MADDNVAPMNRRAAIVTGGAGAIGQASVRCLIEAGMNVVMVDVAADALATAMERIKPEAGRVVPFRADVTDPDQVKRMAEEAIAAFGRVDVLLNVAGGAGSSRVREIDRIDVDVWDEVIELNLKSAFLCSREVVPIMRSQRYGRILNFSSVIARGEKGPLTTVTGRLPYATAKAALIGFTAQLAKDEAAHGITVNALIPGLVLSETGTRIRDRFERLSEAERAAMLGAIPMSRPGEPLEVAAAAVFLVSEAASYISGVALPIDGALL
jgi:NAD(P)-dependent dehydrogenase (short-subunit alcohol dehydrogenase family)